MAIVSPIFDVVYGFPKDLKSLKKMITYAICSDSIYLIRRAGQGHIVTKVEGIAGVTAGPGYEFNTILQRKIPFNAYWQVCKFFRLVLNKFGKDALEAFILVMYNPKEDRFFLHVPEHSVSSGRVQYNIEQVSRLFPGSYIVLDVHSH